MLHKQRVNAITLSLTWQLMSSNSNSNNETTYKKMFKSIQMLLLLLLEQIECDVLFSKIKTYVKVMQTSSLSCMHFRCECTCESMCLILPKTLRYQLCRVKLLKVTHSNALFSQRIKRNNEARWLHTLLSRTTEHKPYWFAMIASVGSMIRPNVTVI